MGQWKAGQLVIAIQCASATYWRTHRYVLLPGYRTAYSSAIFIMSSPLTYLQKWRQVP